VLGLVIAQAILEDDVGAAEGVLAPRYNALVRKETCADVARAIDLGAVLKLGKSEMVSGGRRKEALLGDAMEAVIAAVYLDGGLEAARAMILRFWAPRIASVEADARDPKTALQEALIGEPNAGKSTLLNRMVGAKVSIVTHKVQTTRARIRGVAMEGAAQLVFVDTPGLFKPRRRLDRAMVAAAWTGASDADVVVLMIEAHRGITEGVQAILDGLGERVGGAKVALAINKIDRVKADALLGLTRELNAAFPFVETFMISAEKGHGTDTLRHWLAAQVPVGPWFYPEDQIADLPMRMIAAEITREKLTLRLHQELPYQMTVEKVRPGWLEDSERYSEMGLDFKDGN